MMVDKLSTVEAAWRSDQAANGAGRRRCSGGWGWGTGHRGWGDRLEGSDGERIRVARLAASDLQAPPVR